MLLKEIKNIFQLELKEIYPEEEINGFFYLLIEHYLGLEKFILAIRPNFIVSKEEEKPLFAALSELRLYRPIQYITAMAYFMDLEFMVNENVLIPRPETEELVRWILDDVNSGRTESQGELRILDIGTGSGCIAISLAKTLSSAKIMGLDISEGALKVAKGNAQKLDVEIEFEKADIFELAGLGYKFDIIVSNPPYVRESEKVKMRPNVLEYEPSKALFVPNDNALLYYRAIADFARKNLSKSGKLFLEINQYLAKETRQLLEAHNFMDIEVRKDIYGNKRMIRAGFSKRENNQLL